MPQSYIIRDPVNGIPALSPEMNYINSASLPGFLGPQFDTGLALGLPPSYPTFPAVEDGMPNDPNGTSSGNGGPYVGPYASRTILGEPFAVLLGMIGLLVLLGWFSTRGDTLGGADPAHIRIGGYNLLAVGVTAVIFIVVLKVIANRLNLPGFKEFANAI